MNKLKAFEASIWSGGRLAAEAVLVLTFTTMLAFAAPAACPTSSSSLTRTFTGAGAPTWTVNAPGSSTSNNLANLTTAGGCFATDLTFTAFAVSSTNTGTLEHPAPTASGTYLAQSPDADTLLFSTLQGTGLGGDGAQNDGTDNLKVDTTETLATTLSYGVSDSLGTGLFGVEMTINGVTVQTGGSGTVTLDSCSHGATVITGSITNAAGCTAAGGVGSVFTTSTAIALIQGQTQNVVISFGVTHPTFVNVTEVFNLACISCTTTETGFLSFNNQFFESPEPSTFGLLGTALATIGALACRKRKLQS